LLNPAFDPGPRTRLLPADLPELGEFWNYRVGDYRIIYAIEDVRLMILEVRIGNRREVYR